MNSIVQHSLIFLSVLFGDAEVLKLRGRLSGFAKFMLDDGKAKVNVLGWTFGGASSRSSGRRHGQQKELMELPRC